MPLAPTLDPSRFVSLRACPCSIFNVCGTVGRSAAPYSTVGTLPLGVNTNLPNPHIRGTAVQFIDPPNSNNICADIDTCDQDTNPTCIPGSNNYDGSMAGTTSPITGLIVGANAQRQAVCGTYVCPPPGLPGTQPARDPSGSYQYCCVGVTYCSENSEVLAYYDGDDENVVGEPPIFNLYDENSPSGGINISYIGAKAYSYVEEGIAALSLSRRTYNYPPPPPPPLSQGRSLFVRRFPRPRDWPGHGARLQPLHQVRRERQGSHGHRVVD